MQRKPRLENLPSGFRLVREVSEYDRIFTIFHDLMNLELSRGQDVDTFAAAISEKLEEASSVADAAQKDGFRRQPGCPPHIETKKIT